MNSRSARWAATCCIGLLAAPVAEAHSGDGVQGGLVAGLLHPVTGLDHLLAMVAVGIWGAFLGAPLAWVLPVVFPMLMVVGGVLGIAGIALPSVEIGIAISVIALGLAIAFAWVAPRAVAIALVAVFAIFHGHAHGTELPVAAAPEAYAAGFVLATGSLHLAGIGLGQLRSLDWGTPALRVVGAAMAVAGVWFLVAP